MFLQIFGYVYDWLNLVLGKAAGGLASLNMQYSRIELFTQKLLKFHAKISLFENSYLVKKRFNIWILQNISNWLPNNFNTDLFLSAYTCAYTYTFLNAYAYTNSPA